MGHFSSAISTRAWWRKSQRKCCATNSDLPPRAPRSATMRIVAGRIKGRRLLVPKGRNIRPTADRTRQALFDLLEHGHLRAGGGSAFVDAVVLDAFCGTGALGLEAFSRGAAEVSFMDSSSTAID